MQRVAHTQQQQQQQRQLSLLIHETEELVMRHQICSYYALLLHFQLRLVMQLLQLLVLLLRSFLLTRTPLRVYLCLAWLCFALESVSRAT